MRYKTADRHDVPAFIISIIMCVCFLAFWLFVLLSIFYDTDISQIMADRTDREIIRYSFVFITASAAVIAWLTVRLIRLKRAIRVHERILHEGERFAGKIIRAEYCKTNKLNNTLYYDYFLFIEFTDGDGRQKVYVTQPYYGTPNYYLKDGDCIVYKLNGKYAAGSFSERSLCDCLKIFYIEERIKTIECTDREMPDRNKTGEVHSFR